MPEKHLLSLNTGFIAPIAPVTPPQLYLVEMGASLPILSLPRVLEITTASEADSGGRE